VLQGILVELRKVDRLTDFTYLREQILVPALVYARDRQLITAQEEKILRAAVQAGIAKAADLGVAMPGLNDTQRTYQIKKLVERKMLQPLAKGSRQYSIGFINNYLLRGVINALSAEGFITASLGT
jgi:Fic family protein